MKKKNKKRFWVLIVLVCAAIPLITVISWREFKSQPTTTAAVTQMTEPSFMEQPEGEGEEGELYEQEIVPFEQEGEQEETEEYPQTMPTAPAIEKPMKPSQVAQPEATQEKPTAQPQGKTHTVTIANDIAEKSLNYKHAFINYHPTMFDLTVNGKKIEPGTEQAVPVGDDNMLTIMYYCEFKDGKRKSCKRYFYKLKPNVKSAGITFDWHADPRIMMDKNKAEFISFEPIEV
ncbi:MAG TPA: hypothetical protein VFF04_01010 [Candidatus Babeliales bacterium]|nr:hypothetical protein [Candidatus Babeliales bacterium]